MKAVLLVAPGEARVVDDWPEPECGPRDVVVQVRGVGLCGSDLAIYDGKRPVPALPWVMGHEGGGDVVAVGAEVDRAMLGQRVVIEPNYADLTCAACRAGRTSACADRAILGVNAPGILAERVAVRTPFVWPVPASWPTESLACFEPLAVAHTAVRRSGVRPGQDCLVVGAGSQGLLVAQCLLAAGATPYVVEPHEGRLATAEKLGARAAGAYDGAGYPFVFETSGAPQAWAGAFAAIATGGTLIEIGLSATPVSITTRELVQRQLTLRGALIYDHPGDFAATRDAVAAGELAPDLTVQAGFPVEEAASAFAHAREVPGKSWISFAP